MGRPGDKLRPAEISLPTALQVALEHHQSGRLSKAEAIYRQILLAEPSHADALHLLGAIFNQRGNNDIAAELINKAIQADSSQAIYYNSLGKSLREQGKLDAAIASYRQALLLKPDYAEAYNNLGVALLIQGKQDKAVASYRQALLLKPDYFETYKNLGFALLKQGKTSEAVANYRQALLLKPDCAETYSSLLFSLIHDEHVAPAACRAEHFAFAERFEQPLQAFWQAHGNDRSPDRRLKIGFVSADLRNHAIANFIEPVWAALRSAAVELWAYSNYAAEDAVTARLRLLVQHWRVVVGIGDEELADAIRADGIDILIDLSGHTGYNRLPVFARKPAPVQATWIGYPGTTGLAAIDYLICDRFNAPHGLYERYYSEQFARLPSTGAFEPFKDAPALNPLPALSNGYVTFASFNRQCKLGDAVIAAWSLILQALPDARLLLGNVDDSAQADILTDRFAAYGIGAERLCFKPLLPMRQYLALHHQADIVLDSWPYTGGTTTQHALWMGLPAVTLRGPSRTHCQGAAAMERMGLANWIADDVPGFVRIAVAKARDIEALAALRQGMRQRWLSSPWLNPDIVGRGLETALRVMWRRWCAGLPAEHFDVPLTGGA